MINTPNLSGEPGQAHIETIGGDHVDAAFAAAPDGPWAMIVSVWVKQPRFEQAGGGYVVRSQSAADLVTAAMAAE